MKLEARRDFVEDFEKWAKKAGFKREKGAKGTKEEGLKQFAVEVCKRYCDLHSESLDSCMWTPEAFEGRPFVDEIDWLRKATSRGNWKIDEDEVDF